MTPTSAHTTDFGSSGAGSQTPFDYLTDSLRARASTPSGQTTPTAILWTDPKAEWRALLPVALTRIPELLALGEYRPERRMGPAIWLRCVVDGALDAPGPAPDRTPIIYLPGVERSQLRAGETCPDELKPLVELMYRGVLWHHRNGKDWSVPAFLGSSDGPRLDIATDRGTIAALLGALDQVALTSIAQLRGRPLDAADFNQLAGVDVMRDILRWMADPEGTRSQLEGSRWNAFCAECRSVLLFDPETEADVSAGARLGEGSGRWADVWTRFTEAPEAFPGVPGVLARSRPGNQLLFDRERWPDLNEEDEESVRHALVELGGLAHADACRRIARLEEEHGHRRTWVWARLRRAPFAKLLEPLARLADSVGSAIGGAKPDDVALVYADRGWLADASAREALALAPAEEKQAVADAVRHLLKPWLDRSARAFQASMERQPLPSAGDQAAIVAGEDECIVFVDGLRYELGRRLAERLEATGSKTTIKRRWAAIPTVTATAKPAVTPVAGEVAGDQLGATFQPMMKGSGRTARVQQLREAMESAGYQILNAGTLEMPLGAGARGWLETGEIDKHGHYLRAVPFARQIERELDDLVRRITRLLKAGWRSVRVVTDHGWLFLPGGLPMVTLPRHLTQSKWARCAVISGDSRPDAPLHPWYWNVNEYFATPPGIACFSKRDEYTHGGLSVQECLIPDIRVEGAEDIGPTATIKSISWVRFRCNITVQIRGGSASADLRLGSPTGESVVSTPKSIDADGLASLVLADDEYEDAALVLVVTDADDRILSQRNTRAGVDS